MSDQELVAAVEALAAIADSYHDQPWAVEWLRAHAVQIGAGDEKAVQDLRDHLVDLQQDLVVEHSDPRARHIITVLQTKLAATPRPSARNGPGPEAVGGPTYPAVPEDASRLGLIAGVLGVALVLLGIATILAGQACGSTRREAGIALALLGGGVGVITIGLRAVELRRHGRSWDELTTDFAMLVGAGQLLSLAITWVLVHQLGCTVLGH